MNYILLVELLIVLFLLIIAMKKYKKLSYLYFDEDNPYSLVPFQSKYLHGEFDTSSRRFRALLKGVIRGSDSPDQELIEELKYTFRSPDIDKNEKKHRMHLVLEEYMGYLVRELTLKKQEDLEDRLDHLLQTISEVFLSKTAKLELRDMFVELGQYYQKVKVEKYRP